MKHNKGNLFRLLALVSSLAGIWGFWKYVQLAERNELERIYPERREIRLWQEQNGQRSSVVQPIEGADAGQAPVSATNLAQQFIARAADMNAGERGNLARLFTEKFRPALELWGAAYTNRLPFEVAEVTLDKFHSTLGSHMFSFMLGSTTLTFVTLRDPNAPAKVGYLMVKQAALDMNRLPSKGFIPNLNPPISVGEVLQMIKSDSGREFKPSEIIIRPTGKASALNGGVFVDLLPTGLDPNNALNYKISMVFDASGKLVNYERDPSF